MLWGIVACWGVALVCTLHCLYFRVLDLLGREAESGGAVVDKSDDELGRADKDSGQQQSSNVFPSPVSGTRLSQQNAASTSPLSSSETPSRISSRMWRSWCFHFRISINCI